MKMSTQVDLFTNVEPTSVSPDIAKPFVSRSTFYQGDCLVEMDKIADKSVDMILCDLPYGTTQNKWDAVIPFESLWNQYERVIKDNGVLALFGQDKFSAKLMLSSTYHRYNIIWDKVFPSGHLNAKRAPLRNDETISIFYKKLPTYNPQMTLGNKNHSKITKIAIGNKNYNAYSQVDNTSDMKYPKSIIQFQKPHPSIALHPTQKPVELIEYLVKTYTNEGDTVLDNCMGSGTTGVACVNTNRGFIGIELDESYFAIAEERIWEAIRQKEKDYR